MYLTELSNLLIGYPVNDDTLSDLMDIYRLAQYIKNENVSEDDAMRLIQYYK